MYLTLWFLATAVFMAGGTSGQIQRIWLKKLNYSKYGNKRACSPGYCPQDKVYHNYGNIQGCYCGSDGTSICTGNSITEPEVIRTFQYIDVKEIADNRFEIVDGPDNIPSANCYGGTSKAQMMQELKFGSGSDCASTSKCYDDPARGGFLIDLTDTGFEIDTGSFVQTKGWGSTGTVTIYFWDTEEGRTFDNQSKKIIPETSLKVHVPACGGWGGGCYAKIYLRKKLLSVSGFYYLQKDSYPCLPSQEIKRKSDCRDAATALNRPFNENYKEFANHMGGCIWHMNKRFMYYDNSRDFPFTVNYSHRQVCSHRGEKRDPDSGRCKEFFPGVNPWPHYDGINDGYRGWYDVSGCGVCNDYCRYMHNNCGGEQLDCDYGFWTCALAGTDEKFTKRGTYTGTRANNWPYEKCDYHGQKLNEFSREIDSLDIYTLHQGDTWVYDGLTYEDPSKIWVYHKDTQGHAIFQEAYYKEGDRPYFKMEDHNALVHGQIVENRGPYLTGVLLRMVDQNYIRIFDFYPYQTKTVGGIVYANPLYIKRMMFSQDKRRAPNFFSIHRQIQPGPGGSYELDNSPYTFEQQPGYHDFHSGPYGNLNPLFKMCPDYTGPKPAGGVYSSHMPNGDRATMRQMTIPPTGVYTSTVCMHDVSICGDPLAENCTVVNTFWSEYMVRLPELQGSEPYLLHWHKLHLVTHDFNKFNSNNNDASIDRTLGSWRVPMGSWAAFRPHYDLKVYQDNYGNDITTWEFKFRFLLKECTAPLGGRIGYLNFKNRDPRTQSGTSTTHYEELYWGKHIKSLNKWTDVKVFLKSETSYFNVDVILDENVDGYFRDLIITRVYPYDWHYQNPLAYNNKVQTSMSPTHAPTIALPDSAAQIDFSNPNDSSNTPYTLHGGAQILTGPGGVTSLRIDQDGRYAKIPNFSISPSTYPHLTMMIGLYVESKANNNGWVFSHEDGGYDRTILMHDSRFGGVIASAVGKTWNPGANMALPYKKWIHVTAVFRQGGLSYVFLDGVRSQNVVTASNNEGRNELWIGRPIHGGHWVNCWIKEVKVFYEALENSEVQALSNSFHAAIGV